MHVVARGALVVVCLASSVVTAHASETSEVLSSLAAALGHFRGVGYDDVHSYRVEVVAPDPSEDSVPLQETWRAPDDLTIRAAGPSTPTAVVRSLALYLEPLYVARSSLLEADFEQYADALEAEADVTLTERPSGEREIHVQLPSDPETLPEVLKELLEFRAVLDESGRLLVLDLRMREGEEELGLQCSYHGDEVQPSAAKWSLPSGDIVRIETEFRREAGRLLPSSRVVYFPSRFDPGETEEIYVRYGTYELNASVTDAELADSRTFRYDANGLQAD